MVHRAYCRRCDKAVDAAGAWPGACRVCRTPIEAEPVPDVVGPGVQLLFVGINPGVMTARTRHHFGNPINPFWHLLHEAGFTPRRIRPDEGRELIPLGIGVTNIVPRATPGSADVTAEDIKRGRARLGAHLAQWRPAWVAFVGKQACQMALGQKTVPLGVQPERLQDARVFVLPSTSPANAALSVDQKRRWFVALHKVALGPGGRHRT